MVYKMTIPLFTKTLTNLGAILDKAQAHAEAKKFDVEVLLNSRLAPDQFHFIRQVQIACDTAKLCASRLSGKEAPSHPDTEKTLADLKLRLKETVQYLNTFTAQDFNGSEEKHITTPRWEGKYLLGMDYVTNHAIPNIYFHVSTAYSILRHNGVDIGKKDYLGDLPFRH
jgi:uncharacterized protein